MSELDSVELEDIQWGGGIDTGLSRRNSSLKLGVGSMGVFVEKCYHSRFTVRQEYEAYKKLNELFLNIPGIRLADIYKIDTKHNIIQLEFIDAPNLMEAFLHQGRIV